MACANCGSDATVGECAGCGQYAYCSEQCRLDHWHQEGGHAAECASIGASSDESTRRLFRSAAKSVLAATDRKKGTKAGAATAPVLRKKGNTELARSFFRGAAKSALSMTSRKPGTKAGAAAAAPAAAATGGAKAKGNSWYRSIKKRAMKLYAKSKTPRTKK